ncbi:MAG TPA: hypothetical protein VNU71_17450 [Burkholderiaceae bacterium]|nr:hypothetical protein [Burkholderiaceae bacterium]
MRGLDHRVIARRQPHAGARVDEVVTEIAVARQPDLAGEDDQLTTARAEARRLAGTDLERATVEPLRLRIHHQSPSSVRL